MSGSNFEPMPFKRKFGGNEGAGNIEPTSSGRQPGLKRSLGDYAEELNRRQAAFDDDDAKFVDASGAVIIKPAATGACRKCGFAGHHAFQCYNSVQLRPEAAPLVDISSTSSEDSENETALGQKEKKKKLKKHKIKAKKEKKEKKEKKSKKKHKKEKKRKEKKEKKERKRKRSSSSSSDSSSDGGKSKRKRTRHNSTSSSD